MKTKAKAGVFGVIFALCGCGGDGGENTPPPPPSFTISGTLSGLRSPGVGLTLRLSNGELLKVLYDGAFTFAGAVQQGSSYQVSVDAQPTGPDQTCTVTNGSGNVSVGNVTDVLVKCSTPSITNIVVLNGTGSEREDGFIRGYVLNYSTGALSPKSVEPAPGGASSLAYYAPKQQLYASRWNVEDPNYVDWGLLRYYSFDIYGVPKGQATTGGGREIAINPDDGYLYGLTPGQVSQRFPERVPTYKPGTIFPLTGPNAARDLISAPSYGRGLRKIVIDTKGRMFVTADGDGQADQARILSLSLADPDAPALSASYATTFEPFALAANPDRQILYVTAPKGNTGFVFAYDSSGKLGSASPSEFPAMAGATSALLSSDGTRLYLASRSTGSLQCYLVGSNGIPVAKSPLTFVGVAPIGMAIDPDGKFLYVLNGGDDASADTSSVVGFAIDTDCNLAKIPGAPVPAGSKATAIMAVRFTP